MSLPVGSHTSYRSYSVSSEPAATLRSVSAVPYGGHAGSVSAVPYGGHAGSYESVRYLVPVQQVQQVQQVRQQQQQHQFVMMAPQVMTSQVMAPQVMTSQVMAPQVMTSQLMAPQVMTSQLMAPQVVTSQVMAPQVMAPQVMTPVYLQSVPRISVSSQDSADLNMFQQRCVRASLNGSTSSIFSQSSSPIKSPELVFEEEVQIVDDVVEEEEMVEDEEEELVEVEEVEIINVIARPVEQRRVEQHRVEQHRVEQRRVERQVEQHRVVRQVEQVEQPQVIKMDTRFFGELLAEVYRKNCDIHSCIAEHVAKIRGRTHRLDSASDYKLDRDEVEALIPKGASELTKQQIRYLLQTRLTADKSLRLLLSTFSSLREELLHMSDDLRRLESEKESLESDLSFKADQSQQYDRLLEAVRENNRQLQTSLKESSVSQRSLESQLLNIRTSDSGHDFKLKELEGRLRALEQENDMLKHKLAGQGSSSASLQLKTEELSRQYKEQLAALKQEKEKEVQLLRTQLTRVQTEVTTTKSSSDRSLHLKISELTSLLEQRQRNITHLEQEIKKLRLEISESAKNMTKTTITKRYRNHYPILGLLSDDYLLTSPIKEAKTIVIERTGEIIKQEIILTP